MNQWIDEQVARQRYDDILREERQLRIVEIVVAARKRAIKRSEHFYNPVMAQLGRRLVAWGCRLEARYGSSVETTIVTNTGGNMSGC
jgi:hypothetical protein